MYRTRWAQTLDVIITRSTFTTSFFFPNVNGFQKPYCSHSRLPLLVWFQTKPTTTMSGSQNIRWNSYKRLKCFTMEIFFSRKFYLTASEMKIQINTPILLQSLFSGISWGQLPGLNLTVFRSLAISRWIFTKYQSKIAIVQINVTI